METKRTVFSPADLAKLLEIDVSTLRKYAEALEKHGYKFHKNERGHRGYFEKDIIAVRRLIEMKSHKDVTIESAAKAVMAWVSPDDIAVTAIEPTTLHEPLPFSSLQEQLNEIQHNQNVQMQFNEKLVDELRKELQAQREYIDKALHKRDEALMTAMRSAIETQKQIAAASVPWYKKVFSVFFGKNK